MDGTNTSLAVNQTEPVWDKLGDRERSVLLAMMVSQNDTDAIKISPVGKTQYYRYKKILEPLKKELALCITKKALETLQGNAIKAAEVMVGLLDNYNPNVKHAAAKEILDRTVGQPKKQEIVATSITQIGIIGITKDDLNRLVEPLETP